MPRPPQLAAEPELSPKASIFFETGRDEPPRMEATQLRYAIIDC